MTEAATEIAVDTAIKESAIKMRGSDVSVFYGEKQALFGVNLDVVGFSHHIAKQYRFGLL